jgi:glycine oxidase
MRSTLDLLNQAVQVLPGFFEANITQMQVGTRPTMSNGLPIVKQQCGVIAINGMSRHGFMLSPEITAQVVNKWIES